MMSERSHRALQPAPEEHLCSEAAQSVRVHPALPLRFRAFRRLLVGQAISTWGDAFFTVALPALLLTSHAGPSALGLALASIGIPRVGMLLLGGVLCDLWGARRVMLWSDLLRTGLMALLAALVVLGQPALYVYCVIGALLGACGGVFLPASSAMMPQVLPRPALQAGNALWMIALALATLVGPGIAGLVVSHLQAGSALAIDALTYGVSALTLVLLRPRTRDDVSAPTPPEPATERLTFWQFARTSRLMQMTLLVVFLSNLADGGLQGVALPALAFGPFHAGAEAYGWLLAAYGVGMLLGSLGAGLLRPSRRRGLLALWLLAGDGVGMALLPYLGGVWGAGIALAVWGFANGMRDVLYFTLLQDMIPHHLLGRTLGVILFASYGVYPLSVALIGLFVTRSGPVAIFPLGGVVMFAALLLGLSQRELRRAN